MTRPTINSLMYNLNGSQVFFLHFHHIFVIFFNINYLHTTNDLSMCSAKGRVGKKHLCVNLVVSLANLKSKVLLNDTSPHALLSNFLPIKSRSSYGTSRVFLRSKLGQFINRTVLPRLNVVHSDNKNNRFENHLSKLLNVRCRLRTVIESMQGHDFVLTITQKCSSSFLDAPILSSELILHPIVPDMLSAREFLRGTVQKTNELYNKFHPTGLSKILNGVIYKTWPTTDSMVTAHQFVQHPNGVCPVQPLKTTVPDRAVNRDAASTQVPAHPLKLRRAKVATLRNP